MEQHDVVHRGAFDDDFILDICLHKCITATNLGPIKQLAEYLSQHGNEPFTFTKTFSSHTPTAQLEQDFKNGCDAIGCGRTIGTTALEDYANKVIAGAEGYLAYQVLKNKISGGRLRTLSKVKQSNYYKKLSLMNVYWKGLSSLGRGFLKVILSQVLFEKDRIANKLLDILYHASQRKPISIVNQDEVLFTLDTIIN